ncbi:MAG: non-homologous end-joining DNA ligase [Aridibacter famidurans]|nr:non-homologous end-joining DNA ligase [Aridibacter famidurans]
MKKNDPLKQMSDVASAKAGEAEMPDWIEPMLTTLTHDYFSDDDWIYERKLDGERVIAYIEPAGGVHLMSRNRKNLNKSYPEIEEALEERAPGGCVLDGEVVAFDKHHVSDFQLLQSRMQSSSREESRRKGVRVHYYVFDCMYLAGHMIDECPLRERKKALKAAVDWKDPITFTEHRNKYGLEYYDRACKKGWEGVIAKDASSAYVHSRSKKWLKFKCVMQQELVIGGYTDTGGDRIGFGALLLGYYRNGDLVYAGKVGTGFDDDTLKRLHDRMKKLKRSDSAFDKGDPDTNGANFIDPKLVCEIEFSEWTNAGKLRHPSFKGLRRDKDAGDVVREM